MGRGSLGGFRDGHSSMGQPAPKMQNARRARAPSGHPQLAVGSTAGREAFSTTSAQTAASLRRSALACARSCSYAARAEIPRVPIRTPLACSITCREFSAP